MLNRNVIKQNHKIYSYFIWVDNDVNLRRNIAVKLKIKMFWLFGQNLQNVIIEVKTSDFL